ncbi:MAG: hypothetical protein ACI97A_001317 [Planctomycetota bacterium]|jgi:hypothetical protein
MISRTLRQLIILTPLLLCFSCGGGGDSNADNGAFTLNSQLAIASNYVGGVAGMGTMAFALVNELEQNGSDLNGDGDFADNIVHMIDTVTGAKTNLGYAATVGMVSNNTHIAWGALEASQFNVDLNGDGDTGDRVLVVFDPTLPLSATNPFNTGISIDQSSPLRGDGDLFVFVTNEVNESADLNADLILDDLVIQSFSTATMTPFNTALSTTDFNFQTQFNLILFTADEAAQETGVMGAGADLNGDGDSGDTVLYFADPGAASVTAVGGNPGPGRAVIAASYGIFGTQAAPAFVYTITEGGDGGVSLNATGIVNDLDIEDMICAVFLVASMTEIFPGGGLAVEPTRYSGSDTRLLCSAVESSNTSPGFDFNNDGDFDDLVPFWIDLANPAIANNIVIAQDDGQTGFPFVCGQSILLRASEAAQGPNGTNYNVSQGDTDTGDFVFFHVNTTGGVSIPTNLEMAGSEGLCSPNARDFITIISNEADNGNSDYNTDGDSSDEIAFFYYVDNGVVSNQPIQIGSNGNTTIQDCGNSVRYLSFAPEGTAADFRDENGDGDFDDIVLLSIQILKAEGRIIGKSILGTVEQNTGENMFPILLSPFIVAFPTGEGTIGQGVNLNANQGDGDMSDSILFLGRLDCP